MATVSNISKKLEIQLNQNKKRTNIRPSLLKTLSGLVILTVSPLTTSAAQAMGFQNCTNKDIRVHIYNNKDRSLMIARNGGKVKPNELRIWHQGKKPNQRAIKIFETGGIDALVLTKRDLNGNSDYRVVIDDNGNWNVQPTGFPVGSCPR